MKWLEDAGVDFFDISGGTYESPAWRGNIMTELAERPSQKERGSYFIEWAKEMKKVLVSTLSLLCGRRLARKFTHDCVVPSENRNDRRLERYGSHGRGRCKR
jgi:hypothetical protein